MATWFISHSNLDPADAAQIIERLRADGHESLFLSSHPTLGIQGGSDWESELYRRLRSAVGVVFLASKDSVKSQWCFAELCIARSLDRTIIPFRMDDVERLRLLDDVKWISRGGDEDPYGSLAAALRKASPFSADDFAWDPLRSPYPGLKAFGQEYAPRVLRPGGENRRTAGATAPRVPGWAGPVRGCRWAVRQRQIVPAARGPAAAATAKTRAVGGAACAAARQPAHH